MGCLYIYPHLPINITKNVDKYIAVPWILYGNSQTKANLRNGIAYNAKYLGFGPLKGQVLVFS